MLSTLATFALHAALAAAACIPNTNNNLANSNPNSNTNTNTNTVSGVAIHPNGNSNFCLDVRSNRQVDGTAVQVYDCNQSG